MALGYVGRMLHVDMTDNNVTIETPTDLFYRKYFGGTALIAYYLLQKLRAGVDPLGPDNLLIFATGVLTGIAPSGSGRNSVGAKSPMTGGLGYSEAGGSWGGELKRAGYDAIVIRGRADHPQYLWIHDGQAEFRDASHIWGTSTANAEHTIKKELNDSNLKVSQIGPAGERLVSYACIVNDLSHFAGRCGLGAVMGSKNLRAIAVRGQSRIQVANPQQLLELAKWKASNLTADQKNQNDQGTARLVLNLNATNGLPTRNFKDGIFEQAESISGPRMRDTILIKRDTCYACAIACKRVVKLDKPYQVDPEYGGPEYETIGALGSNCAVDELEALAKVNEICAANGLDTISAGNTIAFAMECAERGLISGESDGVPIKFGSVESMVGLLNLIIRREGIGKMLGEGVKRTAEQIGGSSSEFAMHVKGQEVPMHDPRIKHAMGLGYAVSATGPDHMHNIMDPLYEKETQDLKALAPFGIFEPLPALDLSPSKVRLFIYASLWRHFYNCAVLCLFLKYDVNHMIDFVNGATGWNTSSWELMKVAERAVNMARVFNIREGFTSKDDFLPKRFYEQQGKGLKQNTLTEESLEKAKKLYYGMMGWSEAGVPSAGKLRELDLGWLCDHATS